MPGSHEIPTVKINDLAIPPSRKSLIFWVRINNMSRSTLWLNGGTRRLAPQRKNCVRVNWRKDHCLNGSARWQCAEADNLSRLNVDQAGQAFREEREQVLNPIRASANDEHCNSHQVQILLVGEILVESQ